MANIPYPNIPLNILTLTSKSSVSIGTVWVVASHFKTGLVVHVCICLETGVERVLAFGCFCGVTNKHLLCFPFGVVVLIRGLLAALGVVVLVNPFRTEQNRILFG